ncbi:MAG: hypothetical protein Q4D31_03665 [Eubacteriales bacterium]|nr:hypothetical protein [Eubacteriales bacterium]
MHEHGLTAYQMAAARKSFEWMERSGPSVAARDAHAQPRHDHEAAPEGIALPPHTRDCGRAHPMRGTNSEDLTDWCIRHET